MIDDNSGQVLDALAGQVGADDEVALQALAELADRELCRRKLLHFICRANPAYNPGWMHQVICEKLEKFEQDIKEAMAAGKTGPRLIINCPPRHGKSEIASRSFPAWYLGRNPDHEIIACSYASSLALKFSRSARSLYRSPLFKSIFPEATLDQSSTSAENWLTMSNGGYLAAGVSGPITGTGMHCGIIDDPIKNRDDSSSEVIRESIIDWYTSTFYTRLAPGGGIIVIQCMPGDTQVLMADNTHKSLEDIGTGDIVYGWSEGNGLTPRKVLNHTLQGVDQVYEIKTGNTTTRANARHPFLFKAPDGSFEWVRTRDIPKIMDTHLMVIHGEVSDKYAEPALLNEDQAWMLGYMIGDGWITIRDGKNYDKKRDKYYPRRGYVTCFAKKQHEDRNQRALSFIHNQFGIAPKLTKYGYYRTEKQAVGKWLTSLGFGGNAKTKRIPEFIFRQPKKIREAFISGYLDSDGHIQYKGTAKEHRKITSCNLDLIKDVQRLLRITGRNPTNIWSGKVKAHPPNSLAPVIGDLHSVGWSASKEGEFFYRKVRSITTSDVVPVYDIQVEEDECFVADGVISHNTRWHEGDLSGWLMDEMKRGGDQFEVINFPAIAEEDEKYRKKGEALHEARYPIDVLKQIEKVIGPRDFASLYQQRPSAAEGDQFKRSMLHYYEDKDRPSDKDMTFYQAWDFAIGQKQLNDFTVGICAGIDRNDNLWLVDLVRGKWDSLKIVDEMLDFWELWQAERVGLEHGQIAMALDSLIEKRIAERNMYGFPYNKDENLKPGRQDKVARSAAIRGRMRQRKVFIPKSAPWLSQFIDELLKFPNGNHDDQVDALSWLGIMMNLFYAPRDEAPDDKTPKWLKKLLNQGRFSQHSSTSAMSS